MQPGMSYNHVVYVEQAEQVWNRFGTEFEHPVTLRKHTNNNNLLLLVVVVERGLFRLFRGNAPRVPGRAGACAHTHAGAHARPPARICESISPEKVEHDWTE